MKRGRRSYEELATAKLLDLWEPEPEFGSPLGCVATTYTFDAGFFEEDCLARFTHMNSDANEDPRSYVLESEERLSQVFACVMVDRHNVSAQRSVRWHVLPMSVPRGGRFHAKVSLLVWQDAVRVLVSSANLTEAGYRRNFECMSVLEFRPDGDVPLPILRDVIAFLRGAVEYAKFPPEEAGPHRSLREFLATTEARIGAWSDLAWSRGEASATFVTVEPGTPTVFEQLGELWRGGKPDEAWVLSPYYDADDRARAVVEALDGLMVQRSRALTFVGRGRETDEGAFELEMPGSIEAPVKPSAEHRFGIVTLDADEPRALHAKSLFLRRGDYALFLFGSSNFTAPGTGLRARDAKGKLAPVNVEANVVYTLPDAGSGFAKTCEHATPRYRDLADDVELRFLAARESETADDDAYSTLPPAFAAALFEPAGEGGTLLLTFEGDPPLGFAVIADPHERMLEDAGWRGRGSPQRVELPWARARPPSHLLVRWTAGGVEHTAVWVVNVSDTSKLRPPEEIRTLTLDELLEVLSSSRPLYNAIAAILRRREARARLAVEMATNPHKKVETRNFLLRRMRRVAGALEGLRARLERPAATTEALRWRLHGPIGPLAVARRLAEEEGKGAAFFIAEVALTVCRAHIPALGDVNRDAVDSAVQAVVAELRSLALEHGDGAPENLMRYVESSFEEVLP